MPQAYARALMFCICSDNPLYGSFNPIAPTFNSQSLRYVKCREGPKLSICSNTPPITLTCYNQSFSNLS